MTALNDMREALSHGETRARYTAEELAQHMENDCMIVGYDDVPDMLRKQEAEILMLRTALRQVAHSHAWLAFGECRAFGSALKMLSPSEADEVARIALGEYRQGPNV